MKLLLVNVLIAAAWLLATGWRSTAGFLAGFVLGFVLLALFSAVGDGGRYPRRWLGFVRFAFIFAWEFVKANLSVARIVLFARKDRLHPNFIDYDVSGMTPREVLLLSYCITLTPGTTTVNTSDDLRTLTIHALDAGAPDATRRQIDERLKNPMLRFTR